MFAVLGVTGNTGRACADRLIEMGAPCRVIVRDESKGEPWLARGCEVACADLLDVPALRRAFDGCTAAYVLLPPNPTSTSLITEQRRKTDCIAEAARACGVRHIVCLSSVGAHLADGTGPIKALHNAEGVFRHSVPRTTYVRAAYFMENWGMTFGSISDGIFTTFLNADKPIDMCATADIGRLCADALVSGGCPGTEIIECCSGPNAYTPRQICSYLSTLCGRDLKVIQAPESSMTTTLTQFGQSKDVAKLYTEMVSTLNASKTDLWERSGWFVRGPTTPDRVLATMLNRANAAS